MPIRLVLPGVGVPTEKRSESLLDGLVQVETIHAARVDLTLRGAVATEHRLEDVDDSAVLELEWEGGVREWTSVGRLRQELQRRPGDRSGDRAEKSGELRIPAVRRGPFTRGGFGWVLRGLKVLRVDLAAELADLGAQALVERLESRLQPGPGLYACPADLDLQPTHRLGGDGVTFPAVRPALVLIHGTASSTLGSFGRLAGTMEWDDLRSRYGDAVFALEHFSLSTSPLDNAIALVEQLPPGAEIDLVTHSRGGLVGELICRGEVTDADLEPFQRAGCTEDVERFRRLAALLRERQPRVRRFVRVACPARGTLLAAHRLDRYLSVLLNLFGILPALATSPLYEVLKATLLTLAQRRAEARDLPGLEAQRSESSIIHLLNRPGAGSSDLAVLAGDVQGDGLWGRLTTFATDLFYREDHDLVVNTESMYGGVGGDRRAGKAVFFFDKGPDVHHFSYFGNSSTRVRLHAWLTHTEDDEDIDTLFQDLRQGPSQTTREAADGGSPDQPVVFLLPELFGSRLRDRQGLVWPDLEALALGGMERLSLDQKVQADDLVADPYAALVRFLRFRFRVVPFPYDWRRSVTEAAAALGVAVRVELDGHAGPVSFLAHGLGGLVVRALIAEQGDLWQRAVERGGRLLLLGSPNAGTWFAPRLLLGQARLSHLLDLLDIGHSRAEVLGTFARFPGLLEMLPEELFDADRWPELLKAAGFHRDEAESLMPAEADLQNARAVRERIAAAFGGNGGSGGGSVSRGGGFVDHVESISCVSGTAAWTPGRLDSSPRLGEALSEGTAEGDGRVTYAQSRVPGASTWYVEAGHGELASHRPAFSGYAELLESGKTEQLPARPPERAAVAEPVVTAMTAGWAAAQETLLFPDEPDLLAAALGYEPAPPLVAELLSLRISVAHGSLTHARFPLAVGHYQKDTLVNAESFLDRRLGGALSERYRLGLYPGAVGTVEVLHTPDLSPPGALVIGLGELGEISAQHVTEGVLQAGLRHALLVAERPAGPGEGDRWRSAGFSALLLGTGGGRSLSVEESIGAIVRGVVQANRALRSQGLWKRVRIDEIELIELYEAVAIRAARTVRSIVEHLRIGLEPHERIEPAFHLRSLPGGEVRPPVSQYDTGWWRRLQITTSGTGRMSFEVLTERARTEQRQQFLQQSLVDRFVEEAASSNEYSREVTSTLFELLLPNELKDQAHEETDLVLVLDEGTAQYPWELLTERLQRRGEPFATSAGLMRQLRTREGEFRSLVRAPRERYALVVGDPRSNMEELPGAQDEARAVREVLQAAGYETVSLIRPQGWEVIRELFAREYQMLHLAGHGLYEPGSPRESGMVLGDSLFLSTAELQQLRAVPPFVFLNCCHLGRVDRQTHFSKLAASLATGLIRMGVRAVVAAGWAVDDHLAATFARELYQGLLSGQTFGRSVLRARRAAFEQGPDNNTWGAYQCYGDPDFVLDLRPAYRFRGADPRAFVSPREFLDELAGLRAEAGTTDVAGWDVLRRRLETLESALPRDWRTGELLAALAAALADLGAWWEAITNYREAVEAWGSEVPMQAVQALANLEIRYAGRLRKEGGVAPGEGPKELIDIATRRLQLLLGLGESPERLALVGGAYKRMALAALDSKERRTALRKALEYYGRAHQLVLEKKKAPDPYVSLNWVACRHLMGEGEPEELLCVLTDCERIGSQLAATSPAFHHRLHAVEAVLHRHLILGDLVEQEAPLLEGYRRALSAGSVSREIASVAEHLEFLIASSEKKSPQVTQVLRRIVDSLGGRAALGI